MSSCSIFGFFELTNGRRVETQNKKADGSVVLTNHDFYTSCIICSDEVSMPAEVRKYSSSKDVILQDKTVAYIVAKLNVPPQGGPVLIEAWHVAAVPGDPSSPDEYNSHIPDFLRPIVVGLGVVAAAPDGLPNGAVTFPVTVSDYVRGGVKESTVRCLLDKSSPRWRNVPPPNQASLIEFISRCSEPTTRGILSVDIENIVFCSALSSPSTPSSPSTDRVPNKRRKFGPRATPQDFEVDEHVARGSPSFTSRNVVPLSPVLSQPGASMSSPTPFRAPNTGSALNDDHDDLEYITPLVAQPATISSYAPLPVFASHPDNTVDDTAPSTRSKNKRKAVN